MQTIKVQIDNDPLAGNAREAHMYQCIFTEDREIDLYVNIVDVDENGEPLYLKVQTLELDPSMRESFDKKFEPKKRLHTTRGALIDSQTGLYADEGDISELDYLASLTPAQVQAMFPGENSFLGLIWKFIEARIQTMNAIKKYG